MKRQDPIPLQDLPAGQFSTWLEHSRGSKARKKGTDVPCGECNACCRSSYFIHVRPEETQTLARIPGDLLFAAPGMPRGNVLMGYDEKGCCPMLVDGKCSIYEHRPLACRTYDCRIFAAAGIAAGDKSKFRVDQQTLRWKFDCPTELDRDRFEAVHAAARFLKEHADSFPGGVVPVNPTQVALLAIKVHEVFMDRDGRTGKSGSASPADIAKAVVEASGKVER